MPARDNAFDRTVSDNRLRHSRGYLCGAMDRVTDGGEAWRIELQKELVDLEAYWLDPTHKPIDLGIEDAESRERVRRYKHANRYDLAAAEGKLIRAVDLRMVDISDFLVVNLDLEAYPCGTMEEVALANRQKKPIITRIEQGKENVPNWLLYMYPNEMIFSTWPEVYAYLRHVAFGESVEHYNRWFFFDFSLCRKF